MVMYFLSWIIISYYTKYSKSNDVIQTKKAKMHFSCNNICMSVIDEYLSKLPRPQKSALERIHKIVKKTVPDAEEVISYGMPAFKYKKRPLIYLGAFKNHMSIYPASGSILKIMGDRLEKFRTSKGTLRFSKEKPIPEAVIREMLLLRVDEITKK